MLKGIRVFPVSEEAGQVACGAPARSTGEVEEEQPLRTGLGRRGWGEVIMCIISSAS